MALGDASGRPSQAIFSLKSPLTLAINDHTFMWHFDTGPWAIVPKPKAQPRLCVWGGENRALSLPLHSHSKNEARQSTQYSLSSSPLYPLSSHSLLLHAPSSTPLLTLYRHPGRPRTHRSYVSGELCASGSCIARATQSRSFAPSKPRVAVPFPLI